MRKKIYRAEDWRRIDGSGDCFVGSCTFDRAKAVADAETQYHYLTNSERKQRMIVVAEYSFEVYDGETAQEVYDRQADSDEWPDCADYVEITDKSQEQPYSYFCGCCGHRFKSDIPERDPLGLLNDIACPECGAWDIYPDDENGRRQSVRDEVEHESKLIAWDD